DTAQRAVSRCLTYPAQAKIASNSNCRPGRRPGLALSRPHSPNPRRARHAEISPARTLRSGVADPRGETCSTAQRFPDNDITSGTIEPNFCQGVRASASPERGRCGKGLGAADALEPWGDCEM